MDAVARQLRTNYLRAVVKTEVLGIWRLKSGRMPDNFVEGGDTKRRPRGALLINIQLANLYRVSRFLRAGMQYRLTSKDVAMWRR